MGPAADIPEGDAPLAVEEEEEEDDEEEEVEMGAGGDGGLGAAHQAMLQGGGPVGYQPYNSPNMFPLRVGIPIL